MKHLLALALTAASCWGLEPARILALEGLVTQTMAAEHIPGLSIAVASNGTVWANGYGLADLENMVPVKSWTMFRTASTVKPMTATAAWALVEKGKLDLDAPVQKYLPMFPTKPWPVTTRQLLGHIGGIRGYKDPLEAYITQHYWAFDKSLRIFDADELAAEPGTKYIYSTFGYVLAGAVLEAAAGAPYVDLMRTSVFGPAGMTRTEVDDVYRLIPGRARGYQRSPTGEINNAALADTSHKIPGGGYLSTSEDLVRFAIALDNGTLLRPASIAGMVTPMRTRDGKSTGYGTGWGVNDLKGLRFYVHTGGQAGTSTVLAWIPSQHAAVAIMCNLEGLNLVPAVERAISIALQ